MGSGTAPCRIGLHCACVPREPILAAGLLPVPISGSDDGPSDTALPSNLCAHVRRTASWLGGPGGRSLAGVVIADGCYPMLRLRDLLQSRTGYPENWLLRLPRTHSPEAVRFLREELLGLTRALATLPGARADAEKHMGEAIETEDRRRARSRIIAESFRSGEPSGLTPELLVRLVGPDTDESLSQGAEMTLLPPPGAAAGHPRPGLLVRGSFFITMDFVRMIRELGAEIRLLESCLHERPGTLPIVPAPGHDPFETLADWMLRRPPCPRSGSGEGCPGPGARFSDASGIDGVLFLRMKQCTAQGYDLPILRPALREAGVPLLVLEVEGPDWRQPHLVTRIEAFLESIGARTRVPV